MKKWLGVALTIAITYPIVSMAKEEAVIIKDARHLKILLNTSNKMVAGKVWFDDVTVAEVELWGRKITSFLDRPAI